ncbi:DUF1203 domain-containing protein [Saccharothrix longispora]|uniref:DUF1203 domain-containing protein n=1 Tax=Saccharothrix longispora TaxID=33920 RepID=A0ABU1Q4W8_9PSEU|nr:DUF1203 domain-containing protein [Saccharothrix longispora]MDR6597711.1 hypothetical protein [Saccharothrix longispora]
MKVHPIPADVLARARALAGADEHHELHPDAPGSPLRCCLRKAAPGEPLVLFRYSPPSGRGPYEEVGPVFAHAAPCAGPDGATDLPDDLGRAPRTLRAHTAGGRIHRGETTRPHELADRVAALLDDPAVAVVQVRSASHGCFLYAVTRD